MVKKITRKQLTSQELFETLKTLTLESTRYVQAPGGHNLLKFLCKETDVRGTQTILKKLDELVEFGLIQKENHKNSKRLFRVKLLADSWDEAKIATTISPPRENKRFAIFIDFKNFIDGFRRERRELINFSYILDPMLKQGKLIFAFVFVPQHYLARVPIMELTHKYHFSVVVCPRQTSGAITKDKDTVDAQMEKLSRSLIEHSDITDVVIFAGDADFHELVTTATWQQKKVTMVSTRNSISGRFIEMSSEGRIKIQLAF